MLPTVLVPDSVTVVSVLVGPNTTEALSPAQQIANWQAIRADLEAQGLGVTPLGKAWTQEALDAVFPERGHLSLQ